MKTLECRRCGEPGMLLGGVCRECKAEPEENPAMASDALGVKWIDDVRGKPFKGLFVDASADECFIMNCFGNIALGTEDDPMLLTVSQARALAGILSRFADTGESGPSEASE